jgi:CheY-like chemotaxis protein
MGEPDAQKVRILVIDDNPADVELLRYALRHAGVTCDLTVIATGDEAIEFVQQRGKYPDTSAPDLAVVDLNLPRYDGIEIIGAMRRNPAFATVPVAVFTSSSSPRDRAKIEALKVCRYITKPSDLDEYLRIGSAIKQLLDENQSND